MLNLCYTNHQNANFYHYNTRLLYSYIFHNLHLNYFDTMYLKSPLLYYYLCLFYYLKVNCLFHTCILHALENYKINWMHSHLYMHLLCHVLYQNTIVLHLRRHLFLLSSSRSLQTLPSCFVHFLKNNIHQFHFLVFYKVFLCYYFDIHQPSLFLFLLLDYR